VHALTHAADRYLVGMRDLVFEIQAAVGGSGREAEGTLSVDGEHIRYSAPASMGGKGVGANPESLLISAVTACFSLTLLYYLHKRGLAATGVEVRTQGLVAGHPRDDRYARITVNPKVLGGDPTREVEYRAAALKARDHCFIGQTVAAGGVAYEVGTVEILPSRQPEASV